MSGTWAPFAAELRAARAALGYDTARAFYQSAGGVKNFGTSYRQYLNLESGASGPGAAIVEKLALGLRLSMDPERADSFFRAYLACLLGNETLVELIASALSRRAAAAAGASELSPMVTALGRQTAPQTVMMSREQADCYGKSQAHYTVFNILSNDEGSWDVPALVKLTGLKAGAVGTALKDLHKTGLIEREQDGRYRCPRSLRVFVLPRDEHYAPAADKHRAYLDGMAREDKTLLRHYFSLRVSEAGLNSYFPHLVDAVKGVNLLATGRKGPDTSFAFIEVVARRLFRF